MAKKSGNSRTTVYIYRKVKKHEKITIAGIVINAVLFAVKLLGGILSGSLALLSDSFNSLNDIIASVAIFLAVRIGSKKADLDHPFGHRRAEPIAGLIVAIFAAILGFEVVKNAFEGFFDPKPVTVSGLIYAVILGGIALKLFLFILFRVEARKSRSPAFAASSMDYRNDLLVSFSVLVGIGFGRVGIRIADNVVALFIGLFIIYSGFRIGIENVDYLMGKRPPEDIIRRLTGKALTVQGVKDLNEVKAHFLGNYIHVEVHIEVDKDLSTERSHRIARDVQDLLQEDETVDHAFVHVDPV
jgi:cation diffusion facilitator family transporter